MEFEDKQWYIEDFKIKEGRHTISGIDEYSNDLDFYNESNIIVLCIDDINYGFYENPDNDYRSYGMIKELPNYKCKYTFPPQPVDLTIKEERNDGDLKTYILEFKDATNGKIVLEIGTEHLDDYYPCAISHWHPENLEINKNAYKI